MPTFTIPNAYLAGPPVSGRYHIHELLSVGDVDGNTYRNLLYAGQLIITAHPDNGTGDVYVGNKYVSPTNYDKLLDPEESIQSDVGGPMDRYLCTSVVQAAPVAPTVANGAAGTNLLTAGAYKWKITFVTAAGETQGGTASATVTNNPATELPPDLSVIPTGAAGTTARKVYRTVAGGTVYKLSGTIADNTTTVYNDNVADASLGATAPTTNSAVPQKVNIFWETESFIEE